MLTLLAKIFVEKKADKRSAYGMLCSGYGIFLNIILCIGKFFAGSLSGSIAITADAYNNLSDAGSSLITLLGFKIAAKKPNPNHPFGHGRFEYISGLIVSFLILLMGYDLAKESVGKIIHPEASEFNIVAIIILVVSILVKFYMAFYNKRIGKKINSVSMNATAMDSLSDTVSTFIVLASTLVSHFTSLNIDGYVGTLVAIFILYTGLKSAVETIKPLLGQPPEEEFVKQIEQIVKADENVLGIHDLVVHDYGPGRTMITLHAEIPASSDIIKVHDAIDNLEFKLNRELSTHATIHIDPVENDNPVVVKYKNSVKKIVTDIDKDITMHDFRIVSGETHTNLIFDVVVPQNYKISDDELRNMIKKSVKEIYPECFCVINVDKAFC